jgi:3-methylfumaryl-CoA hydratase
MTVGHAGWIGRRQVATDLVTAALVRRWQATVAGPLHPLTTAAAPCLHWALCLPEEVELGDDGHPPRGGFLPPVDLPRRMWAGGRVEWFDTLAPGDTVQRRSTVSAVQPKRGATGDLVFVTVDHEISTDRGIAVRERQDIVYRRPPQQGAAPAAPPAGPPPRPAVQRRTIEPSVPWLFRFSALTFNAHRIHYDRPYATLVDGYEGLVVHGPLLAALMATLAAELASGRGGTLTAMDFRALRPVFDTGPFDVCVGWRPDTIDVIDAWIEVGGAMHSTATVAAAR